MVAEMGKAWLGKKQYLSANQEAWLLVIAISGFLVQFCVVGITIVARRYWLLLPELPLLLLANLSSRLFKAVATSLDERADQPISN
jgi:hypothetical protein